MDRHMDLFQRAHQTLQPIGQGDGRRGIGQQEGAGNQHQDPARHKDSPLQSVGGNGQLPQPDQYPAGIGVKEVQHTGKDQDHNQGLHALDNGFGRDPGDPDGCQQKRQHHTVGDPALGAEQGNNIEHHRNQLGPGVQTVDKGGAGEILAQSDIFKHGRIPPSPSAAPPRRHPRYRPWAHPPQAPEASETPESPEGC